jgi:hypothetical protein
LPFTEVNFSTCIFVKLNPITVILTHLILVLSCVNDGKPQVVFKGCCFISATSKC